MTRPRTPATVASLFTVLLAGCAVNPRPTFDEANASVKSRTGLETTWMRSEAEERAVLARLRDPLSGAVVKSTESGWSFPLEPETTRWLWIEASE